MRYKFLISILFICLFFSTLYSNDTETDFKTISKEQCLKYFPSSFYDVRVYPNTNAVYILPSHEEDTARQNQLNQLYKEEIFVRFILPGLNIKIVTDEDALKMDLSDVNIFAFGTVKGNLWISNFFKKAKDFPIQIKDSIIIADTIYKISNQTLIATWYNPDNFKHSVAMYIPLTIKCNYSYYTKYNPYFGTIGTLPQYAIADENKIIAYGKYYLKNGKWNCFKQKDSDKFIKDSTVVIVPERPRLPEFRAFKEIEGASYLGYYPNLQDFKSCNITDNEVITDTLNIKDINENFDNINDLEWLKPVCKNYKIITLAENYHHLKYSSYFLNRILFALNTYDYFPVLVCEMPYSWGAYINYYLEIKNDIDAEIYCDSVFSKLNIPKIFYPIRKWNKKYPSKKIEVACSDIEHDLYKTIASVLNPYFSKIRPDIKLNINWKDTLNSYIKESEELLIEARNKNIIGDYPFHTPEYIAAVLENVKTSAPVIYNQEGFMKNRYKLMIRNVSSNQFLGEKIANNKCMFYGGDQHFQMLYRTKQPLQETEGTFLARKFEPTKGKMYVIRLVTLGITIEDSVCRVRPELGIESEKEMVKLYKAGRIKLNEKYIDKTSCPDGFWDYFYKLSYKYPDCAFHIKDFNLQNFSNLNYSGLELDYIALQLAYIMDYNTTIVIPYSPFGFN